MTAGLVRQPVVYLAGNARVAFGKIDVGYECQRRPGFAVVVR